MEVRIVLPNTLPGLGIVILRFLKTISNARYKEMDRADAPLEMITLYCTHDRIFVCTTNFNISLDAALVWAALSLI